MEEEEGFLEERYGSPPLPPESNPQDLPGKKRKQRGGRAVRARQIAREAAAYDRPLMLDDYRDYDAPDAMDNMDVSEDPREDLWLEDRYADRYSEPAPQRQQQQQQHLPSAWGTVPTRGRERGRGRGDMFRPPAARDTGWGNRAPPSATEQPSQHMDPATYDMPAHPAQNSAGPATGSSSEVERSALASRAPQRRTSSPDEQASPPVKRARHSPPPAVLERVSPPPVRHAPPPVRDAPPHRRESTHGSTDHGNAPGVRTLDERDSAPPRTIHPSREAYMARDVPPPRDSYSQNPYARGRSPSESMAPRRAWGPPRGFSPPPEDRISHIQERRRSPSPPILNRGRPGPVHRQEPVRPTAGPFADPRPPPASYSRPGVYSGHPAGPSGVVQAGSASYVREPYNRPLPPQDLPMSAISAREAFSRGSLAESVATPNVESPGEATATNYTDAPSTRVYSAPPALLPDVVKEIAAIRAQRFGILLRDNLAASAASRRALHELSLREADGRAAKEATRLADLQIERFNQAAASAAISSGSFGAS